MRAHPRPARSVRAYVCSGGRVRVRLRARLHLAVCRPWPAVLCAVAAAAFLGLLLAVDARFGPLERADHAVAGDLHGPVVEHPAWRAWLRVLTDYVGDPTTFRLLIALAALVWWRRGRPRAAVWAVVVMATGAAVGNLVKVVLARPRPHLPDPVATAGGWSFPSGHALTATLGCGVLLAALATAGRAARATGWALAVLSVASVAFTRVALGVHYLSDVVAGVLLGVLLLAVCTTVVDPATRGGPFRHAGDTGRGRSPTPASPDSRAFVSGPPR